MEPRQSEEHKMRLQQLTLALTCILAVCIAGCGGCRRFVPPPVINSFTASSHVIEAGESVTIRWDVTGAKYLRLKSTNSNGGGSEAMITSGRAVSLQPEGNTIWTFALTATNEKGESVESDLALVVVSCKGIDFCFDFNEAVGSNDLDKVKKLLQSKPTLALNRDHNGVTALHIAAAVGQKEVADLLISKGADVNAKIAAGLCNGGDARFDCDSDETPLHFAAESGNHDVAALLLAKGANTNANGEMYGRGATPLFYAADRGHRDMAELLLKNGADVNASGNGYGDSPLYRASINGRKDLVELLLAYGADVDARNNTYEPPLYAAALAGSKDVVELLLSKGANINAMGYQGAPLHAAAKNCRKDVVELLLSKGADVNAGETMHGLRVDKTPLRYVPPQCEDVADLLRHHGGHK